MDGTASPIWITAINFVGAVNALILAATMLALPATRRSATAQHLIALLSIIGVVSLMVTLQHAGLLAWTPWREIFEQALTLLAGPLFLGYTIRSLTGRSASRWIYLPLGIHLVAVVLFGRTLISYVRIEQLVWLQMAYSLLAAGLVLGRWVSEPGQREGREHLVVFVAVLIVLHAGQAIRVLRPDDPRFLDIVPLTLTFALAVILVYAVVRSRALLLLAREPAGETADRADEALAQRIEQAMQTEKLYADPGLGVQELAALLGVAPLRVSKAVNRCLGTSLPRYLAQCRLEEAERLLADPAERRFTVEGIGRQAGFGSRSAFYRAFTDKHGESPASYRERLLSGD